MTLLDVQLRVSSEFAPIQMPTSSPLTVLTLPATVAAALLPDPNLSVLQLLEFPLSPASTINLTKLNLCPSAYFSSDQLNVDDLDIIKMIPVPPVDTIDVLLAHAAMLHITTGRIYKLNSVCPYHQHDHPILSSTLDNHILGRGLISVKNCLPTLHGC